MISPWKSISKNVLLPQLMGTQKEKSFSDYGPHSDISTDFVTNSVNRNTQSWLHVHISMSKTFFCLKVSLVSSFLFKH